MSCITVTRKIILHHDPKLKKTHVDECLNMTSISVFHTVVSGCNTNYTTGFEKETDTEVTTHCSHIETQFTTQINKSNKQ